MPTNDRYPEYYAEKIWELIPSHYRHEDGLGDNPGVLRAIVELWAAQAARLRRSHDRLWEDTFIDLCDGWAVPYLADLVGARLVAASNPRGRRVDVAKTIYYRRRKGTVRVLEELIADVTGWEGKVVESFRGMARPRHRLDPAPAPLAGRFSQTPPGGWADLRDVRAAALVGGPFDEHAHTADVRRPRGHDGRWNLPVVQMHLYRLGEHRVTGVTPCVRQDGLSFTFDPSGRDVPLFMPRARRDDWDDWRSAQPWELPAPMSCRLLNHAELVIEEALVQSLESTGMINLAEAALLRARIGVCFRSEVRLREHLTALTPGLVDPPVFDAILRGALVEDCGQRALLPAALAVEPVAGAPVPPERTIGGNADQSYRPPGKDLIVDPERGRFRTLGGELPAPETIRVSYHHGFSGAIGAGTYDRSATVQRCDVQVPATGSGGAILVTDVATDGVSEIADSASYGPISSLRSVVRTVLQARDRCRPYLRLGGDWEIEAAPGREADLVLDGLWIGAAVPSAVVLKGAWRSVVLRHCTLDPGGDDSDGSRIHPVALLVEGQIDELVLDRTIAPLVATRKQGLVDRIAVRDSILHAPVAAVPAIALSPGSVTLERVTVVGGVDVERLSASEALITGTVDVTDTQAGCFRFSAAAPGSRLPRPHASHLIEGAERFFTSRRFGDPGYTQLAAHAPIELTRGAENGSEIGAWNHLMNPIKLDSLAVKVGEYLPFGLVPAFIQQT